MSVILILVRIHRICLGSLTGVSVETLPIYVHTAYRYSIGGYQVLPLKWKN